MTLRSDLYKIATADTGADMGLLIIRYLEDIGLCLEDNGWLDDDPIARERLWSQETKQELEEALETHIE